MLVILADRQVLSAESVCPGCLLANHQGLPRWQEGRLSCGHFLGRQGAGQPALYECQMGFRVADIER